MGSLSGVWNGDVDLGDGKLEELRRNYDQRVALASSVARIDNRHGLELELQKCVDSLEDDISFLDDGFRLTVEDYRKKFENQSTPEENLKSANWNVVEFQTLLQQAQFIKEVYEEQLACLNPAVYLLRHMLTIRTSLRGLVKEVKGYLRNLFKKKRIAATHVLVLVLSDERRNKKPYTLPVRYVPYKSLRDQYVHDLTRDVKLKMQERDLNLVGKYIYFLL